MAALATAALCSGCLFGNEPPPALQIGGQIGNFDSNCIRDIPQTAREYFNGAVQDDAKLSAMWDCGAAALTEFKLLVRGSQPNQLAGADLVTFLNRFLKDQEKIGDALRVQAMKVKVAVLGGALDDLTPSEIDDTISLLRLLQRHSLALRKLMPLTPAHMETLREDDLSGLLDRLSSFGQELGGFVQGRGAGYAFDDLAVFLGELERTFLPNAAPGNAIDWVRAELPALRVLKSIVAGGDGDSVASNEWQSTLATAVQIFGTVLYFDNQNANHGPDWVSTAGFDAAARIAHRGIDILLAVGANQPNGVVPAAKVQKLVTTLQTMLGQPPGAPDPTGEIGRSTVKLADLAAKALLGKQALLGGDPFSIDVTRAAGLHAVIDLLKAPGLSLYQTLVQDDFEGATDGQVSNWLRQFDDAVPPTVAAVGQLRENAPAETFAGLAALNQAVAPLFELATFRQSIADGINEARGARAALLGPPYESVNAGDWRPLARQGLQLARLYLVSRHKPTPPADGSVSPQELGYWWTLFNGGATALDAALAARGAKSGPGLLDSELLTLLNALPSSMAHKADLVALVPDMLALKAGLFGGSGHALGRADLDRLRAFLTVAKAQTYALRPYYPIDFSAFASWSYDRIDDLAWRLEDAFAHLGAAVGAPDAPDFPMSSFYTLVGHLGSFVTNPALIGNLIEAIPVLGGFKAVAVAEPHDKIAAADWKPLLTGLGSWGGLGLRLYQFIKQAPDWYSGAALERMNVLTDQALLKFRASASARQPQEINFADFDQLYMAGYTVAANHGVEMPMQLSTLESFTRPALRRLAGGANSGATGRQANGFSVATIDLTRTRLARWVHNQRVLEQAFTDMAGPDADAAIKGDGFARVPLAAQLSGMTGSEDALWLLKTYRPLFIGTRGNISFLYDGAREALYSFNDLSKKNLYLMMLTAFTQGYAEDPARATAGLNGLGVTQDELQTLVVDVHNMISDMRFGPQDQPDPELAKQRFLEANTFMSVSNGDSYFDLTEGLEYVAFLGSSKSLTTPIWADIIANCPHSGADPYGRDGVTAECYRQRFFDKAIMDRNLGAAMPAMVAAYQSLTPAQQATFMTELETAARHGVYNDTPITSFTGENFVTLLAYIESMFKRFDVDRRGQLTVKQALAVFPVICHKLQAVSGLPGTCLPRWGMLESLFGQLIITGTVPKKAGPSIIDKITTGVSFIAWMLKWATIRDCKEKCSYRVDRARVLQIVESLATNPSPTNPAFDFQLAEWGEAACSAF